MANSKPEIVHLASNLLKNGKPYREIQLELKKQFGSGLSNNTLKKIKKTIEKDESKDREITRLKQELTLFKNLYFELLEETNKSLNSQERSLI